MQSGVTITEAGFVLSATSHAANGHFYSLQTAFNPVSATKANTTGPFLHRIQNHFHTQNENCEICKQTSKPEESETI